MPSRWVVLIVSIVVLVGLSTMGEQASAYREYFTAEQKNRLAKIQTVLVEALALTDKGSADGKPLADVASHRLSALGYTVVEDSTKPHDVVFRIKCEQRKTWEGTTAAG